MKPMSLTSPESIAREYGGNKQKIAQAARMGLVDPTAAVMAGMFIDRMRTAAADEQKADTTVAQDILGAPPQQMAPQAAPQQPQPPMARPPMPQPQQAQGIPAAQMAAAQPQMAPGVEGLPTGNVGNYAGGGIVAFGTGGMTDARAKELGYESAADFESWQKRYGPPLESQTFFVPAQPTVRYIDTEELSPEEQRVRDSTLADMAANVPADNRAVVGNTSPDAGRNAMRAGVARQNDAPTRFGLDGRATYTGGVDALRAGMSNRPDTTNENVLRALNNFAPKTSAAPTEFDIKNSQPYTGGVDALRAGMSTRPEGNAASIPEVRADGRPVTRADVAQALDRNADYGLRSIMFNRDGTPKTEAKPNAAPETNAYGIKYPDFNRNLRLGAEQAKSLVHVPEEESQEKSIEGVDKLYTAMGVDKNLYKNQIAKLEEERAGLKGEKDEAKWMRLMEAGFATMAGESPHALVNLGKGASEAMKGFAQDIKDVRKAEKDLTRTQMALETSENQFKVDKSKAVQSRMEKNQERKDKAEQTLATAASNLTASMNTLTGVQYSADTGAASHKETTKMTSDATRFAATEHANATRFAASREDAAIARIQKETPGLSYADALGVLHEQKNRGFDRYNSIRTALNKVDEQILNDDTVRKLESDLTTLNKDKEGNKDKIAKLQKDLKERKEYYYGQAGISQATRDFIAEEDARIAAKAKARNAPKAGVDQGGANQGGANPAAAAPPPAAIAVLKKNPSATAKAQFDTIFGAGAADRALGKK